MTAHPRRRPAGPLTLPEILTGLPRTPCHSLLLDYDPVLRVLAIRRRGYTMAVPIDAIELLVDPAAEPDLFGVCLRCGSAYGNCGQGFCEHDDTEES